MQETTDTLSDSARGLLNRARAFCAGAEQCRSAVRRKLSDWGADGDTAEVLVERLVEDGYIDERRYARAYCESKLLCTRWGERKVRYELMNKGLPHDIIDEAIAEVDGCEREEAIHDIAAKKMATLHDMDEATMRRRLAAYLAQRGFGMEEIGRTVAEIMKTN